MKTEMYKTLISDSEIFTPSKFLPNTSNHCIYLMLHIRSLRIRPNRLRIIFYIEGVSVLEFILCFTCRPDSLVRTRFVIRIIFHE